MSYTLVEQVKIRLKQFHIEEVEDEATGEKSDKVCLLYTSPSPRD